MPGFILTQSSPQAEQWLIILEALFLELFEESHNLCRRFFWELVSARM